MRKQMERQSEADVEEEVGQSDGSLDRCGAASSGGGEEGRNASLPLGNYP